MSSLFRFSVRLLGAFLVAKFLLGLLGADTPQVILGFSLLLVFLTYLFDWLDRYYQGAWRRALSPAEIGWRMARFLIGMNQLPNRQIHPPPKEPPPADRQDP
jgi:hypothetical protein